MEGFKVAIVGSGPAGLSAAGRAAALDKESGADSPSYILLEKQAQPSDTIFRFQKGKHVMAEPGYLNQPNDVIVGPDGSIYVSDGHNGQGMTTNGAMQAGIEAGNTARIVKFSPEGEYLMEWGGIGVEHGQFRTPHALEFDSRGRLWVADRGNHRLEIFDQDGNYLESRYTYGRISGIFITDDDMVYAIDSESSPTNHPNWRNGVRIGPLDEDRIVGFIPPFERESRVYQGTAGEGVAVDADGNVYAAEGPNSLEWAGGAFTKYVAGN